MAMKTFLQWGETNHPELNDLWENTKRTVFSANYPPQAGSGQYPGGYFTPIKATAALDYENMKKKNIVTPPDTAA